VAGALLDVEMEALFEGTAFVSGAKSSVEDPLQFFCLGHGLKKFGGGSVPRRYCERIGPMENFPRLCVRRMMFPQRAQYPLAYHHHDIVDAHEDRWPLIYSLTMPNPVISLNEVIPNEVLRGNSKPRVPAVRVRLRFT
jgi:hypothetical protein